MTQYEPVISLNEYEPNDPQSSAESPPVNSVDRLNISEIKNNSQNNLPTSSKTNDADSLEKNAPYPIVPPLKKICPGF